MLFLQYHKFKLFTLLLFFIVYMIVHHSLQLSFCIFYPNCRQSLSNLELFFFILIDFLKKIKLNKICCSSPQNVRFYLQDSELYKWVSYWKCHTGRFSVPSLPAKLWVCKYITPPTGTGLINLQIKRHCHIEQLKVFYCNTFRQYQFNSISEIFVLFSANSFTNLLAFL